ncbi:hypothetical protein BBW65_05145 [Helicobacter enhydrae]|uniref:Uncharacterized protein n=1 Tax=Helicobacter enhydrae TaxID=222136 RepID=A0A1B1U693_9HELI|nr:hypothetical protein BBW65_05145 [Helicobacter enhydrae]
MLKPRFKKKALRDSGITKEHSPQAKPKNKNQRFKTCIEYALLNPSTQTLLRYNIFLFHI